MVNWIYWGATCDSGLSIDGLYAWQWSYVIEKEEKTETEKIMKVTYWITLMSLIDVPPRLLSFRKFSTQDILIPHTPVY